MIPKLKKFKMICTYTRTYIWYKPFIIAKILLKILIGNKLSMVWGGNMFLFLDPYTFGDEHILDS
jgi:hypothetical protein